MKLKNFCVNQKWCLGFAEVRHFISNNAIQINNVIATDENIELNIGDIVKFGKHKMAIVGED